MVLKLNRVSQFKYLGVVFDGRLSWNDHIKYLPTKAGKRVGILGRIRYSSSYSKANTIYTSLIRPIIEYCDSVWRCCGQVNSRAMEALQRRAARIVMRATDSDSAMDNLKWPTLEQRRRKHILNLVEKCIKGHCPQYFNNYFIFNKEIHSRTTRQKNLLHLPRVRLEVAKKAFYFHGCTVYNDFQSR